MIGFTSAGGDKDFTLLWTNPNPTAIFGQVTIPIDLSQYKYIAINCTYSTTTASTNTVRSICIQPVPSQTSGTGISPIVVAFENQSSGTLRSLTVSSSGVTFYNGYQALSGSGFSPGSSMCIPLKIYGIKGDLK